ncbi:hypothetical protein K1719_011702 [Acacia pycnantha]|nr:hypothetical protein K1719_011702 [Acacia pycnantha]
MLVFLLSLKSQELVASPLSPDLSTLTLSLAQKKVLEFQMLKRNRCNCFNNNSFDNELDIFGGPYSAILETRSRSNERKIEEERRCDRREPDCLRSRHLSIP